MPYSSWGKGNLPLCAHTLSHLRSSLLLFAELLSELFLLHSQEIAPALGSTFCLPDRLPPSHQFTC